MPNYIGQDLPALTECRKRIVATWSPCCGLIRVGEQEPPVMHTGGCRANHGGVLGPTIYLTPAARDADNGESPRG